MKLGEPSGEIGNLLKGNVKMPWFPIETAPKDGTKIDIWISGPDGYGDRETDVKWHDGHWVRHDAYLGDYVEQDDLMPGYSVTHWMTIPDGP